MSKEVFMAEHERLTAEYMDRHGCDWNEAYEATSDLAYDAMRDRLADMADDLRQRAKDAKL